MQERVIAAVGLPLAQLALTDQGDAATFARHNGALYADCGGERLRGDRGLVEVVAASAAVAGGLSDGADPVSSCCRFTCIGGRSVR